MDNLFIFGMVGFFLVLATFIGITFKKIRARFADSPYAIVSFGFAFVLAITYFFLVITPDIDPKSLKEIRSLSFFATATLSLFLFLYFDSLLELKPSLYRFIPIFTLWIINLIIIFLDLSGTFIRTDVTTLSAFTGFLVGCFTFAFAIYVTHVTAKLFKHTGLRLDSIAMGGDVYRRIHISW